MGVVFFVGVGEFDLYISRILKTEHLTSRSEMMFSPSYMELNEIPAKMAVVDVALRLLWQDHLVS